MSAKHFNPMDPFRVLITTENEEWIVDKSFNNEAGAKRSATIYMKKNPEHAARVITRESAAQWKDEWDAELKKSQETDEILTLLEPVQRTEKPIVAIPDNVLNYITRGATLSIKESWKRIAVKMYGDASVNAALK